MRKLSDIVAPLVTDGNTVCSQQRAILRKGVLADKDATDKAVEHKENALHVLLPALRLLVASLYAVLQVAQELEADEELATNQQARPEKKEAGQLSEEHSVSCNSSDDLHLDLDIFEGCQDIIDHMRYYDPYEWSKELDERFETICHAYRNELDHTILSPEATTSLRALQLRLDLFLLRDLHAVYDIDEGRIAAEVDAPLACWWLNLLNADEAAREPQEHCKEKAYRERRRVRQIDYAIGAQQWPLHAASLWNTTREECTITDEARLRKGKLYGTRFQSIKTLGFDRAQETTGTIASEVIKLFDPARKWNFVQWLLEYIELNTTSMEDRRHGRGDMHIWKEEFCTHPAPRLQVAAALGLCEVVESILEREDKPYTTKLLPAPALCALLGSISLSPSRLESRDEADELGPLESHEAGPSRWRTIETLIFASSLPKPEPWVYTSCSMDVGAEYKLTVTQRLLELAQQDDGSDLFLRAPSFHIDIDDELLFHIETVLGETFGNGGSGPMAERYAQTQMCLLRVYDCAMERDDGAGGIFADVAYKAHRFTSMYFDIHRSPSKQIAWLDDECLHKSVMKAMAMDDSFAFTRYISDDRFNPGRININAQEGGDIFHALVGSDQVELIEILLEREDARNDGAHVLSGRNHDGQTPLMLVESTEMLALLVENYNADTTATDNYGRNIWHLMAGSNDCEMIKTLSQIDSRKEENLQAVSTTGNTPLAMAFLSVKEHPAIFYDGRLPSGDMLSVLLKLFDPGPESLTSQTPLPHLLAEWAGGNTAKHLSGAIKELQSAGADFQALEPDGRSMLFHLSLEQSPDIITRLCSLYPATPLFDGCNVFLLTAVFENHFQRALVNKHTYEVGNPLPCIRPSVKGALKALLVGLPRLQDSLRTTAPSSSSSSEQRHDNSDGTIWGTVCATYLAFAKKCIALAERDRNGPEAEVDNTTLLIIVPLLQTLRNTFEDLIELGALREYEQTTGRSGATVFAEIYEPDADVWVTSLEFAEELIGGATQMQTLCTPKPLAGHIADCVEHYAMPTMDKVLLEKFLSK